MTVAIAEIQVKPEQLFGIPELGLFYWLLTTSQHARKELGGEPNDAEIVFTQGALHRGDIEKYHWSIPAASYLGTAQHGESVKLTAELLEKQGTVELLSVAQIPDGMHFVNNVGSLYEKQATSNEKLVYLKQKLRHFTVQSRADIRSAMDGTN